jgi:hypothetical protein
MAANTGITPGFIMIMSALGIAFGKALVSAFRKKRRKD